VFDADRLKDAAARSRRFEPLFRAQTEMWDLVGKILDDHEITLREGIEHDLSLVVGTSLTKALKTFVSIQDLCLLGADEDALILLRSNVNLLINLGYILTDSEPVERALDFIAYSYQKREKYLKTAHGVDKAPRKSAMSEEEQAARAKRWEPSQHREAGRADTEVLLHHRLQVLFQLRAL